MFLLCQEPLCFNKLDQRSYVTTLYNLSQTNSLNVPGLSATGRNRNEGVSQTEQHGTVSWNHPSFLWSMNLPAKSSGDASSFIFNVCLLANCGSEVHSVGCRGDSLVCWKWGYVVLMASNSRAEDVQAALQRAKMKISNLQQQLWQQSDRSEVKRFMCVIITVCVVCWLTRLLVSLSKLLWTDGRLICRGCDELCQSQKWE